MRARQRSLKPLLVFRRTFLASLAAPCSLLASQASATPPVIERAWFGPSDRVHGHDALGLGRYPGRVHAIVRDSGRQHEVHLDLAVDAAFEDGLIRLADLDADGSPQIVLVTASRLAGAAITVLGVERRAGAPVLLERARGPSVGGGRWLNPVGVGDFFGDGRSDVVAVATPHIGGVLTLYRYQRPHLVPVAHELNVSNHVYGEVEQQLAAVTVRDGRMCVAIPNQGRHMLRFLAPTRVGSWVSIAPDAVFDQAIQRVRLGNGNRLEVKSGTKNWSLR